MTNNEASLYEWAEYNLPQELRPASKALSPLARRVLAVDRGATTAASTWLLGAPVRKSSTLGALMLPGLGLPLPKL